MDIQMSYIVVPCLGGLIGYIKNDIAYACCFIRGSQGQVPSNRNEC